MPYFSSHPLHFFLRWYAREYIRVFNSGISGGTSWKGRLIGVTDYENNPSNHPIVVKLETGTKSDYFVGFNRATGVNSDNQQFSDRVTVTKVAAGDGKGYSQSYIKSSLKGGRSFTLDGWRNSGMDLVIKVTKINTSKR